MAGSVTDLATPHRPKVIVVCPLCLEGVPSPQPADRGVQTLVATPDWIAFPSLIHLCNLDFKENPWQTPKT